MKYSVNQKLNRALCEIEQQILSINNTVEDSIQEMLNYMDNFHRESDYNIAQYGNLLVYYDDIREFYKDCGYKTTQKFSNEKL